jgi:hypothetical protein
MAAIYSNGGNRWNILGFNFTKRDTLSSVYKISVAETHRTPFDNAARFFSFWKLIKQPMKGNFKRYVEKITQNVKALLNI